MSLCNILANERRRAICNLFFDWLRPCKDMGQKSENGLKSWIALCKYRRFTIFLVTLGKYRRQSSWSYSVYLNLLEMRSNRRYQISIVLFGISSCHVQCRRVFFDASQHFIKSKKKCLQSCNCSSEHFKVLGGCFNTKILFPDSKVQGSNMGPIWGRQDPGGPMLAPWTLLSGFLPV